MTRTKQRTPKPRALWVPPAQRDLVIEEAKKFKRSAQDVSALIVEQFFLLKPIERHLLIKRLPAKRGGRVPL